MWKIVRKLYWRKRPGGKLRPLCAASGLVRAGRRFWAAADDLQHLIELKDGSRYGRGHRIFAGGLPRDPARRKKVKKDIEALIALPGGRLLALPSGSRRRRCVGALIELDARGRVSGVRKIDFCGLMKALAAQIPGLNIEGGFLAGERIMLLQRGNGRKRFNALVSVELGAFLAGLRGRWKDSALELMIQRIELGKWRGIPLSFTDGFFHDGAVYFSAAAESGGDVYRDGTVLGSVVGRLDGRRPVVLARREGEKIEGLALESERGGRLRVYAVTDADDPPRPSLLLRGWIRKAARRSGRPRWRRRTRRAGRDGGRRARAG